MKRKKPLTYYHSHGFKREDKIEPVQCLGANCPLCGMWMESKEPETTPRKPKTPNLLDKHVVGFGKQSFTRLFN